MIAAEEHRGRIGRLQAALGGAGVDGLLVRRRRTCAT